MKTFLTAPLLLIVVSGAARADACHDRFVEIYTNQDISGPTKSFNTTEMQGMTMTNRFYWVSADHSMSEPVEPKMQWSMTYGKTMYVSNDGKSWSKLRDLDEGSDPAVVKENLKTNAETVRNTTCGEEELNGVMHETVEGDVTTLQGGQIESHNKYWVRPDDDDFIPRTVYDMTTNGMKVRVTQEAERAPDLKLQVPE